MMVNDLRLPPALQGVFFSFRWDKRALWDLPTPATLLPIAELDWHLDLPVWSTQPPLHPQHWQRILNAPLAYALDLFEYNGRWVIMDGYHRLAKHHVLQSVEALARLHPARLLDVVRR